MDGVATAMGNEELSASIVAATLVSLIATEFAAELAAGDVGTGGGGTADVIMVGAGEECVSLATGGDSTAACSVVSAAGSAGGEVKTGGVGGMFVTLTDVCGSF